MTYLLDTGLPYKHYAWYDNFIDYVKAKWTIPRTREFSETVSIELATYNAKTTLSSFIEFDTKEDALAFVLRFS